MVLNHATRLSRHVRASWAGFSETSSGLLGIVFQPPAVLTNPLTVAVHRLKKPFIYAGLNNLNTDGHRWTQISQGERIVFGHTRTVIGLCGVAAATLFNPWFGVGGGAARRGKAVEGHRIPRRWRVRGDAGITRWVWECACPCSGTLRGGRAVRGSEMHKLKFGKQKFGNDRWQAMGAGWREALARAGGQSSARRALGNRRVRVRYDGAHGVTRPARIGQDWRRRLVRGF